MRALVPLVFRKGEELKDKWIAMLDGDGEKQCEVIVDACHWVSRATFDVIGLAGFDYNFNAFYDGTKRTIFVAYTGDGLKGAILAKEHVFRTLNGG
ncbi:hypothetical protein MPER_07138, partial [Moniliophthora perniciosa FA553]